MLEVSILIYYGIYYYWYCYCYYYYYLIQYLKSNIYLVYEYTISHSIFWGVFRTQSNMYDGAFWKNRSILDVRLVSKYGSAFQHSAVITIFVVKLRHLLRPSCFCEIWAVCVHMHQIIPRHSLDYLKKTSIKINVATDESNSRNEIEHWANDEIGVAVQSWLWVRVELMAW